MMRDKHEIASTLFGFYLLGLVFWQIIDTKRIIDNDLDLNFDGATTISDWWLAWVRAWQTPARAIFEAMDSKILSFLELDTSNMPEWIMGTASILAWGIIAFAPLLLLYVFLDILFSAGNTE